MGARVAVAGASGYAGGELLRLLASHPDLELAAVTADSSAGRTVGELHPHLVGLRGLSGLTLQPHGPEVLSECDLLFLALPAGQSAVLAGQISGAVKIVDLGPDFRLADAAAWARHYSGPHPGRWVTGTPELPGARTQIQVSSRVAAPGCYATAAILALAPLVAAGVADPGDVVIVAASGTSGAGRSPRTDLLASEVLGSVSAYQVAGAHRHTPEIEQALAEAAGTGTPAGSHRQGPAAGRAAPGRGSAPAGHLAPAGHPAPAWPRSVRVSFTPVLAPMPRGILATCTARLAHPGTTTEQLRDTLAAAYDGEPFVTVLPEGRWPATASVAGSNGVHLQAAADSAAGRVVVVAAIDNLGKGAAGQAIQDANLMLALPEPAGLTAVGVAP